MIPIAPKPEIQPSYYAKIPRVNLTSLRILFEKVKTVVNRGDNRNSLRQATFFSGGNFLAQIIMMVYAILVARALGPEQLGIYSGLYAILGVSVTFVNFGLDLWLLKEAHNYDSVRIITGKVLQIKLILGGAWVLLGWLILPKVRPDIYSQGLVLLAAGDVLLDVIFNTMVNAWNVQRKVRTINIFLLVSRLGKLILLLTLINTGNVSPTSIVTSRFVVSLLVASLSLLLVKPVLTRKPLQNIVATVKGSADYGFSEILATIYANIDVAILSFYSIGATGLYSPASGIIHALFIIPNSVHVFLLPKFSAMVSKGKPKDIKQSASRVVQIFAIIGLALSLALFLSSNFLVKTFLGNQYTSSANLLAILSPILFFKSISFGFALIIIITNNQRKRLLPQLVVSLFNIVVNLLLIPRYGVVAVAWVYVLSEVLLTLGYYLIVKKIIKKAENETDEA